MPSGVRFLWLGRVSEGVVFSKLSKLLNQEDALSVPCLQGDFVLSAGMHSRAAAMLRKDGIRRCYRLRSPSHHADKR